MLNRNGRQYSHRREGCVRIDLGPAAVHSRGPRMYGDTSCQEMNQRPYHHAGKVDWQAILRSGRQREWDLDSLKSLAKRAKSSLPRQFGISVSDVETALRLIQSREQRQDQELVEVIPATGCPQSDAGRKE